MNPLIAWSLRNAREQTLSLLSGVPEGRSRAQAVDGQQHPVWVAGHLLLADVYLLYLLGAKLQSDFEDLIRLHGPGATPSASSTEYLPISSLIERLEQTGRQRCESVEGADLSVPTKDRALASSQPTLAHHLQALIFHEGYHCGQLAAWRRTAGLPPSAWVLAPR